MSLLLLFSIGLLAATEAQVLERAVPEPLILTPPVFPADLPPHTTDVYGVVRCTVAPDGTVSKAEMVKPIGPREDAAILEVAMRWVFKPSVHHGVPLEAMVDVPVHIETHPQESSVRTTPGKTAEMTTVVRGKSPPPPAMAAGDIEIDIGKLSNVPRSNASKLLTLAPGVLLTNHGGEGHAPQIFLRGFDAGEGKDVEMQLQGVPLNDVSNSHGHGYADTNLIIPELVTGLRVTEGNLHASQGDFSVAGTVNYQLGLRERGAGLKLEYGAFNEQRVLGFFGPASTSDGTFFGAQFRRGSGFGPSRSHDSATALGQWELLSTESSRLRLLGGFTAGRFGSAGVIRADDLALSQLPCGDSTREQFFCTYDANQGGAQQRHLLMLDWDTRVGKGRLHQQAFLIGRNMRLQENFTGFVNDLPPLGESQRGDNTELTYGGQTVGLRGAYRPESTDTFSSEFGYLVRHDDVTSTSRRRRALTAIPYRVVFDNAIQVTYLAAYAHTQWKPSKKWTLRGGLRLDSFFFAVTDRNRPAVDREGARLTSENIEAYGYMPSPRISIEHHFTENTSWLTGAGLGARSSDASALSESEFAPFAQVASLETGIRWKRKKDSLDIELRGAGYATHVSQDFVFDEVAGRNQPVGASNRLGAFGYSRLLGSFFDVQANLAFAYATLPSAGQPAWRVWEGTALPYVPRLLGRLDGALFKEFSIRSQKVRGQFSLGSSYIGPRPLPLNEFAQPIFLVDTAASVRWKAVELGLGVENLFDTLWREAEFNYVSNFRGPDAVASRLATRHFSAGAPRLWKLSFTIHFDT